VTDARLVLITTSHRVAAGLLSRQAWSWLEQADVIAIAAEHPLRSELDDRPVELVDVSGLPDLVDRAGSEVVVLVWDQATAKDATEQLARTLMNQTEPPVLEAVAGSWDLPGARLLDLVAVMDRLRSPGGCPWDAEQTHASLVPYLLEEAYETVEAVESGDDTALREELGDLLLQVVFHARIGLERAEEPWGVDDVAAGITAKLISRHPHVFADVRADTPEQVESNWEELKRAEKGRTSAMDGVPLAMPALALADKLMDRAARAGVQVTVAAPLGAGSSGVESPDGLGELSGPEQLGDLLLHLVALARAAGLDAEAALREAARGYAGRVRAAEAERNRPAGDEASSATHPRG